ncbi:MAG TPA: aminotransferase class I/II-fold pyridoxal phosphate-dependent enzyme [Azospirillaceae bacterium]|nr:aminotransferase class I/II-fold pyridoxal phosphate-dependent enzyme [Azospirillaceae bacterium]
MRFAPLVNRVAGSGAEAWALHVRARQMQAQGRAILFLTVGDPDFDAPAPVTEAAVTALRTGRTHYSPISGEPQVRAAVAARHQAAHGVPTTAENVVLVPGAQPGVFFALQCLAGPGDEVIVPEPMYATYEAVVGATGATLVNVPLRPETGFHLDLEALARAVTPRTRVIWINTPHNPSGAVMTAGEVAFVCDLARRHDLWVLSDEVYERMVFDRPHVSPCSLPGMAGRTVVVSSLSKSHAMSGYRFGWIVAPKEAAAHLGNVLLCSLYGGPPFVQDAALAALTLDLPEVGIMRDAYRRRASLFVERLANQPGLRAVPPEGGMFVMLDIRGTGLGAFAFGERLLEEEGVAVLPCDGFGASAAGHLRVSLAADDDKLADAADRIARLARRLRDDA